MRQIKKRWSPQCPEAQLSLCWPDSAPGRGAALPGVLGSNQVTWLTLTEIPLSLPLYRSAVCFLTGRETYLKRSANLESDGQLLPRAGISRGGERNGEWEPCCLSWLVDELRGEVRGQERWGHGSTQVFDEALPGSIQPSCSLSQPSQSSWPFCYLCIFLLCNQCFLTPDWVLVSIPAFLSWRYHLVVGQLEQSGSMVALFSFLS